MVDQNPAQVWLNQVIETPIDPDQRIIDPHHHLWRRPEDDYLIQDLWQDTSAGHKVMMTVFVECGAEYHTDSRPLTGAVRAPAQADHRDRWTMGLNWNAAGTSHR